MIIKEIDNLELIESTIRKPYIWPHVTDDLVPDNFKPSPPIANFLYYLGVFNPEYCGFFLLERCNCITYEIHTALEKNCRGQSAKDAANVVVDWVFNNTECERLITQVPADNKLAEKLCISAGMQFYGINDHSFKRGGIVQSVKLYGITKEVTACL